MSINNLPNDVVKHEIMTYIKPPYKVWEVSYIQIKSKISYEDDEINLNTSNVKRTGLFRLLTEEEVAESKDNGYRVGNSSFVKGEQSFNPYNGIMSKETLCRMDEIRKNGEIATFHQDNCYGAETHTTYIYMGHRLIAS